MEFVLKTRALPMLFPTVSPPSTLSSLPSRSFRTELSPSYFQWFPLCPPSLPKLSLPPPCHRFRIAPSQRNSPQAISHSFPSVHPVVASSQRSSPQAISHGFPSVHPVVASISLLPNGALPKLFAMVSPTSTLSSLPSPSFPTELSPSYFPQFPFRPPCRRFHLPPSPRSSPQAISHDFPSVHPVVGALPKLFPTVSLPSNPVASISFLPHRALPKHLVVASVSLSCRFRIAPSQRISPHAISHGFPSLHLVVASVSLLPNGALPKLFPTVSRPSTLSSLPYRSFPAELSPSYLPWFPLRPPCRRFHLPPSPRSSPQAISHDFPVRPPCRRFRNTPSPRSSPQAICHGFPSVHPVVASISLLPHGALPKLFPTVSRSVHLVVASVTLLPHGALPKLFAMVSPPSTLSSLPSPSFPTELSPSYFPRFPRPSTLLSLPYRSLAASATKREPKHWRCFWEKGG